MRTLKTSKHMMVRDYYELILVEFQTKSTLTTKKKAKRSSPKKNLKIRENSAKMKKSIFRFRFIRTVLPSSQLHGVCKNREKPSLL